MSSWMVNTAIEAGIEALALIPRMHFAIIHGGVESALGHSGKPP
jgi:hypothetical protein